MVQAWLWAQDAACVRVCADLFPASTHSFMNLAVCLCSECACYICACDCDEPSRHSAAHTALWAVSNGAFPLYSDFPILGGGCL